MEPNDSKLFTALFSISFLFIAVLGFINASQSYRIEKLEKMEQRIEVLERSTEKGSSLKGDTTTSSASGEDITRAPAGNLNTERSGNSSSANIAPLDWDTYPHWLQATLLMALALASPVIISVTILFLVLTNRLT